MIGRPARSGGGGSPSHLSHYGFRADARSPITDTRLKREGGTFHFSLRNFTEQSTWLWQFRLECASHSLMLFGLRALPSYRFQGGNRKEIHVFPFTRTDPSKMTSPHPLRARHRVLWGACRVPSDSRGRRLWQGAAPGSSALGPVREPRPNGRPGRMTVCPSSSTPPMIDHIILHRAPTPSWERPDVNACGA